MHEHLRGKIVKKMFRLKLCTGQVYVNKTPHPNHKKSKRTNK